MDASMKQAVVLQRPFKSGQMVIVFRAMGQTFVLSFLRETQVEQAIEQIFKWCFALANASAGSPVSMTSAYMLQELMTSARICPSEFWPKTDAILARMLSASKFAPVKISTLVPDWDQKQEEDYGKGAGEHHFESSGPLLAGVIRSVGNWLHENRTFIDTVIYTWTALAAVWVLWRMAK
jgi:hypothetical protein